jgi:DNA-binding Xre family transcriptional regulator
MVAMSTNFNDYVKDIEAGLSSEQRAILETFRGHYAVANQLLKLRLDRGVSQIELSRRTGIAQAEISKIERGVTAPRTGTLDKLARALDARVALLAS